VIGGGAGDDFSQNVIIPAFMVPWEAADALLKQPEGVSVLAVRPHTAPEAAFDDLVDILQFRPEDWPATVEERERWFRDLIMANHPASPHVRLSGGREGVVVWWVESNLLCYCCWCCCCCQHDDDGDVVVVVVAVVMVVFAPRTGTLVPVPTARAGRGEGCVWNGVCRTHGCAAGRHFNRHLA